MLLFCYLYFVPLWLIQCTGLTLCYCIAYLVPSIFVELRMRIFMFHGSGRIRTSHVFPLLSIEPTLGRMSLSEFGGLY